MAGELHSPPDDGARARADDVDGEQVRADALADRIAAYAPAGSDARMSAARPSAGADPYELLVPVAPEIAARLGADWSEPVQFRLVERGDGYEMILRTVAEAARMDPECSLCAAGHVPARPCGEDPPTAKLLMELRTLEGGDPEGAHVEADELLLEHIGDPEITRAFEAIRKWYA